MKLQINGRECDVNFGMKFMKHLDGVHFIEQNGIRIGAGITSVVPGLLQKDPVPLAEILYYGLWDNNPRPTQTEIDNFLENPETDIDALITEVFQEIQKSNITKGTMKNFEQSLPEEYRLKK